MSDFTEVPKKECDMMMAACYRILNDFFRYQVASNAFDLDQDEKDFSTILAEQLIAKMREFQASNPNEIDYHVFLNLLAHYPVSMCARQISPLMSRLIGFIYQIGQITKRNLDKDTKDHIEKVSMEEVAMWFCRSKATVKEHVDRTADEWKEFYEQIELDEMRERAKAVALEDMIKEEKNKLQQAKNEEKTDVEQK